MTQTTLTKKIDIVKEILDIIAECKDDGMECMISMQVCLHLKDNYGYDRAEATELLTGALLIDELELIK